MLAGMIENLCRERTNLEVVADVPTNEWGREDSFSGDSAVCQAQLA